MNVLYALSHQADWVDFAREMEKRLSWKPVYWLTSHLVEASIKENFPACVTQLYPDVIRGKSPKGFNMYAPAALDEKVMETYAFELDQALKMMDRLDSGDAFSYNERKRYALRILNYALNIVDWFKPEVAVFTETPHHATQFILYAVLKRSGVKTIMFKPVFIYDLRMLIYNDISDDPFATLKNYTLHDQTDPEVEKRIAEYIVRLRSDYTLGVPDYMKKVIDTQSHSKAFTNTFVRILKKGNLLNLLDKDKSTNILKLPDTSIEDSVPNRFQLYWIKAKGSVRKKKLKRVYDELIVQNPDVSKPFVFIPLQYQPERTSSPDGGGYVDQFLMISLIRKVLPKEVPIIVKEHASQFHPKMDGHLGRWEFQYRDIAALENVFLVSENITTFSLIDTCLCVATLTGTVGLEAVARKKPVLVFGPGCWYRSLPGAFYVPDTESLTAAIKEIQKGVVFRDQDLSDFLLRYYQITFIGKLTPAYPVNISQPENVNNIVQAVERYCRTVFKLS